MDYKERKYQHVERFGTDEVQGINQGKCYIFPKLDGTNGAVWAEPNFQTMMSTNMIMCGSRNRELGETSEADNSGFCKAIRADERFQRFFKYNADLTLYGEWMIPHTVRTYEQNVWKKFYVFDVVKIVETEMGGFRKDYLTYEEYSEILDIFGIEYLKPLAILENPTMEELLEVANNNTYLIDEKNEGAKGEGIVIKNYEFVNKYGRKTWAKIVLQEFKEDKRQMWGEAKEKDLLEEKAVEQFLTNEVIEKEYQKLLLELDGWRAQYIPQLLGRVWNTFVNEEVWNIVKKYKCPTIDFKLLQFFVNNKIKQVKNNLF